ncbi:MAG: dihydrofolate reductase family protein [Chloroflexota bacterium]
MRKVVGSLFITLDGVTESPDQWQEHFDAEMLAELRNQIQTQDAMLLGRVTYEEWFPYWPTATHEPFASHINNVPKYVVSTTLKQVEWGQFHNITLFKGSLAEEIAKLKAQPGKNIGVNGSPSLIRSLLQNDLLDELRLAVHPVVANKGKRLFQDGNDLKRLKLIENTSTSTDTVILVYHPSR